MKVNNSSQKLNTNEIPKKELPVSEPEKKERILSPISDKLKIQSQQMQMIKNDATKAMLAATQTKSVAKKANSTPVRENRSAPVINTSQNTILNILKEVPLNDKLIQVLAQTVLQEAYDKGIFTPAETKSEPLQEKNTNAKLPEKTRGKTEPKTIQKQMLPPIQLREKSQIRTKTKAQSDTGNDVKPEANIAKNNKETTISSLEKEVKETPVVKNAEIKSSSLKKKQISSKLTSKLTANTSAETDYSKEKNVDKKNIPESRTSVQSASVHLKKQIEINHPETKAINKQQTTVEPSPKQKVQIIKKNATADIDSKTLLKKLLTTEFPHTKNMQEKSVKTEAFEQKITGFIQEVKNKQETHERNKLIKTQGLQLETGKKEVSNSARKETDTSLKNNSTQKISSDKTILENILGMKKAILFSSALDLLHRTQTRTPAQETLLSLMQSLQLPTNSVEQIGLWLKNRPDNQALAKALEQIQQGQLQDIAFTSDGLKEDGKAIIRLLSEQRVSELRQSPDSNMTYALPNPQNPDKPIQLSIKRNTTSNANSPAHRERWNISLNFDLGKKGLLRIAALWEKKALSLEIRADSHSLLSTAQSHFPLVEKHLSAMGIEQKSTHFKLLPAKAEIIQSKSGESGLHIQI